MKRSPSDNLFSKLVRTRAKWTCEHCGAWFGDDKGRLHCSHHISRRFNATRWDSRNASAHCAACHRRFTDDPVMHGEWIEAAIGKDTYLELRASAPPSCQLPQPSPQDIKDTLNCPLDEMNKVPYGEFLFFRVSQEITAVPLSTS